MSTLHFLVKEITIAAAIQKRVWELAGGSKITYKQSPNLESDSFIVECKYIATDKRDSIRSTIMDEFPGTQVRPTA